MSLVLPVNLTDTLDQWRQKFNALINAVDNLPDQNIFELDEPVNDQDILVYDATDQVFKNTGINSLVAEVISQNVANESQLKPFFMANQRNVF